MRAARCRCFRGLKIFIDLIFFLPFFLFPSILLSSIAIAAQIGTLEKDSSLFELPNKDSQSLQSLQSGTQLQVSNLPTQGFYKVRTADGKIGWVSADDLKVTNPPGEQKSEAKPEEAPPEAAPEAKEEKKPEEKQEEKPEEKKPEEKKLTYLSKSSKLDHRVRFQAFGGLNFYSAPGIINNLGSFGPGYGYGLEMGIFLSNNFLLLLRAEQIVKSQYISDTISKDTIYVTLQSTPLQAGYELRLFKTRRIAVYFAGLAGYAMNTSISSSSSVAVSAAANIQNVSTGTFTGMAKLTLYVNVTDHFAIFGEGGYRYLKTPTFDLDLTTGSIFATSFNINMSGPLASLGLSYAF